ncbi:hypothetical protein ABIB94_007486 [Bradyrhizobium sp. JR7.2]|uniref:Uncharacterized protein n=1 Tax=Bradyrhizobium barranii TaxID=2992140 RepID=A0ABY3R056_9BRAD|nr:MULTISPECIES: hypothetical protein [Bradyrhizobium]UFW91668.1 hypothetical protein BjapCC829_47815 [Bradyrhizobium japonicum]WFU00194.1 hypothetical protein QA633_48700 [Bradyrhizobium barranii]
MTITDRIQNTSYGPTARNYDGLILLGYAAFAVLALAATYLAAAGPGVADVDVVVAAVMP